MMPISTNVIYTGKRKSSGLAIYLKDIFLHTKKDEWSQYVPHIYNHYLFPLIIQTTHWQSV